MAEQNFSFLDQVGLGPSQQEKQTIDSYGISLPEPTEWDKSLSKSYNPSILPINPRVNSEVIGNIPQAPATPGDYGKYSTENYANGIADLIKTSSQWADDPASYAQPFSYGAGWRAGNFERYYASPSFKKLGYFPGRDNEAIYNENTGFLGDFTRMVPAMAGLTVDAFQDMASEWGSWGLDDPDTAMAEDFQHAMSVGMSSKGGVGGFVTNLGLNLAYPIGIMGEMFAEDLALAAITYFSGGTTAEATLPTMAARTTRGLQKIGQAFKNIGNIKQGISSAYDAVRSIKDLNKARELYNSAKLGKIGNFINPFEHTTAYFKNYDKLEGISDWAKRARGAEALYRDARFINAVTGEAKLEAGFRKIEHSDELINDYYNNNGFLPTGEELDKINQNASDAAFAVSLTNIPMIFLTDKIIFDTAFKGSKFLRTPEAVGEEMLSKTGKKLIVENGAPKLINRYSGENLKRVFTPRALAARSMRYLGKNFAQGIQETFQDVIQESFGEYYSHVYKDPTTASFAASLGTGLTNQMTAQGFETFLSGFFMGGALSVAQTALFNGILGKGKQIFDPKGHKKFQDKVDKYINDFTNTYTDIAKNPAKFNSALRGLDSALVRSKDMADFAEASGLDNDSVKEVIDAQDEQVFATLISFIEAGHGNHLTDLIGDFKALGNEDLAKMFGVDPGADDAGVDARKRLDIFEKRVNLANSLWKNSFRDIVNPVDYKKAKQEGDIEALQRYEVFEMYRRLAVFHFYSLSRAIDRQESIYNKLMGMKMGNIPSSEVSPLFTTTALNDHIRTLTYELKALKEIDSPEYAKKKEELDSLLEYKEALKEHLEVFASDAQLNLIAAEMQHGEDYAEVKELSRREVLKSKAKLRSIYKNIVKKVANRYDTSILDRDLNNMFSMVHDHLIINRDIRDIAEIADIITNPKHSKELLDRWLPEVTAKLREDKFKLYAEGLKKFFDKEAVDALTKELFNLGVVLPEEQLMRLMHRPPLPVTEVVDLTTNKKIPVTEGKGIEAKKLIDKFVEEFSIAPKEEEVKPSNEALNQDPGVGEDATDKEVATKKKRIGAGVPLAKYPEELNDLRDRLQAAFDKVKETSPEITEKMFLEGLVAMEIMDDYYSAQEKPAEAPKVEPAVTPVQVTPAVTPAVVVEDPAVKAARERNAKVIDKRISLLSEQRELLERDITSITDTLEYLDQLLAVSQESSGNEVQAILNKIAELEAIIKSNTAKRTKKGISIAESVSSLKNQIRGEFSVTTDIANRIRSLKEQVNQMTQIQQDLTNQINYYRNLIKDPTLSKLDKKDIEDRIEKIKRKSSVIQNLIGKLKEVIRKSVIYLNEFIKVWRKNDAEYQALSKKIGYKAVSTDNLTAITNQLDADEVSDKTYDQLKAEMESTLEKVLSNIDAIEIAEESKALEEKRLQDLQDKLRTYDNQIRYLTDLLSPIQGEVKKEPLPKSPPSAPKPQAAKKTEPVIKKAETKAKEEKAAAVVAAVTPVTPTPTPAPVSDIEAKKAALKQQIDALPDDMIYATHITNDDVAEKIYNSQFQFNLGTALQGTVGISSKESLYTLLSNLLEGNSPHRGYTGVFLLAFPKSEFGVPSAEKRVNLDTIESQMLDTYPEFMGGKIPTKFNFGYFKNGVLVTPKSKPTKPLQKTTLPVANKYKGSIVYVSPGAGKSFLFNLHSNIIDTDELIRVKMEQSGMKREPNETVGQFIVRGFETSPAKMERIYVETLMEMKSLVSVGLTVLTGTNRWISEADHVIITEDDAKLEANLKGGMTVEAFRAKEKERLEEPAKPNRTVEYLTVNQTLGELLTTKSKEETPTFNSIDLINESKDLKELKENWKKIEEFHVKTQTIIGPDIQTVYQAKLTDLTRDVTTETVEVGSKLKIKNNVRSVSNDNFVELYAGAIVEVVSKNSRGVTLARVNALPGTKKTIYLTNKRFNAMGSSLYDSSIPDEVIPTPQAENEKVAKENKVVTKDEVKDNIDLIAEIRNKKKNNPGAKPDDAKPC
jgi:hypothetical protein